MLEVWSCKLLGWILIASQPYLFCWHSFASPANPVQGKSEVFKGKPVDLKFGGKASVREISAQVDISVHFAWRSDINKLSFWAEFGVDSLSNWKVFYFRADES